MRPLLALLILAATPGGRCLLEQLAAARRQVSNDAARRDQSGHLEPGHQPRDEPGGQPVGLILLA